jgi:UDP-N-acetylglucosamine 2-epimerase (non-hydrolysing)
VLCTEALGYLDFLSLESGAGAVVSDSGGIQEETSALGIPCYTFRRSTERPITLTHGTNVLIGDDPRAISIIRPSQQPPVPSAIPGWDGHAGLRVADVLASSAVLDLPSRVSA